MYYFIGIKGAGMASLACILDDLGYRVLGSDIDKHIFTEEMLEKHKIDILPFNKENIKDHMTVIIGNAFDEDFFEVEVARNNPTVTCYRYHEFLGKFMENYISYSVAGSHGKTTTTSMLASMLNYNVPTGYLIGDGTGEIKKDSEHFVIESCEYKRHFLAYHPDYAIITNIDLDHVDYFKTEEDYSLAYEEFAKQVKKCSILFGDDPKVRDLKIDSNKIYYGIEEFNDVQAVDIVETKDYMEFTVLYHKEKFYRFHLPFVGRHMLWNSLAVITVGILCNLNGEKINEGLSHFTGAKRRFVVEEIDDCVFVDDYAHHPTEVSVTIDAAKMRFPDHKIIAVFKPHRVSRVYSFVDQFTEALKKADEVFLCPFTSIDDKEDGIDIEIDYLADKIEGSYIVEDEDETAIILANMRPAVYLFMSSKDIYSLADKVKALQKKHSA